MKRISTKFIATLFLAGLWMLLPHNPFCSYCQHHDKQIVVFYTSDLQGTLAPCG